jgi:transposase-like protein
MERYTITNFNNDFPNDDACLEWLKNHLYPNGIFCKKCERVTKHHRIITRHSYSCDVCGHHVHPTVGTIFEKSPTPLKLWFHAIYLMSSTRCGISAKQIERETGVSYKTAWRMFKQIRTILEEDHGNMVGHIEADETYIGGKHHGKRGRGSEGKTPVVGMAQRNGKIMATAVPDVKAKTLLPIIKERVLPNAIIYTDELPSYNKLSSMGYVHHRIHHVLKVYVMGDAHTNTIEGFWSLLKRGISGVYHSVSAKYLQSYLNEYTFRYNHRNDGKPMFKTLLSLVKVSSDSPF